MQETEFFVILPKVAAEYPDKTDSLYSQLLMDFFHDTLPVMRLFSVCKGANQGVWLPLTIIPAGNLVNDSSKRKPGRKGAQNLSLGISRAQRVEI